MVKPGYKQTELGLLPEEWECREMGSFSNVCMCKRIFAEQTLEMGEIPFYKIGTFGKKADAYISRTLFEEYKHKYSYPQKGDVLISAAGTLGRTVVYDGEEAYFQDSNIVWLDIDKSQISNDYLYHYYKVIKWAPSEGSTIARLYNGIITSTCVAVPPKPEQEAIAEALSDIDTLIVNLEKLIAKKKAIKQGAMQELLTGKRRLPGFNRDWQHFKLNELCHIEMGQSPDSRYYSSSEGIPLVQGNADIENRQTIIRFYTKNVTKEASKGDIIFTVRAPVGNVAYAMFDCCIGRGVCALQSGSDFLYHLLVFEQDMWSKFSSGSTFDSINSDTLSNTMFFVPADEKEQAAIAHILADMDKEITVLQNRLIKTQNIKFGMMSELLTGRIRLMDKEDA